MSISYKKSAKCIEDFCMKLQNENISGLLNIEAKAYLDMCIFPVIPTIIQPIGDIVEIEYFE